MPTSSQFLKNITGIRAGFRNKRSKLQYDARKCCESKEKFDVYHRLTERGKRPAYLLYTKDSIEFAE